MPYEEFEAKLERRARRLSKPVRALGAGVRAPRTGKARHCLAPVRRLERVRAEAEGGAAGTVAL